MQDSIIAGGTTFGTAMATNHDGITSVLLALISGILAPLVVEYIRERRAARRAKKQAK